MSKMYYISYHAVTPYGNEFGSWAVSEIKDLAFVEKLAEQINRAKYDGTASITIIAWSKFHSEDKGCWTCGITSGLLITFNNGRICRRCKEQITKL